MSTPNPYANINDVGALRTLVEGFKSKLIELEFADSPDAGQISKCVDKIAEISDRIVQLSEGQETGQSSTVVDRNLDKDIRDRVSRIPEFDAKSEVSIFLRECGTVYDTLVKDQNSQVEVEFVRKLKCRLYQPYLAALNSSGQSMTTFAEFKSYMEANHQSKESHYQHLEKLEALEIGAHQNYRDYALQVDAVVDQIKTVVKARWENRDRTGHSIKSEKDAPTTQSVPAMTIDNIFDIFAGMYVLKAVKRDQTTYTAICHELDHCWSAKDVALKASNVSERKVQSNELSQPLQINFTRSKQNHQSDKKDKQISCGLYLEGVCTESPCPEGFYHDGALKFWMDRRKSQPQNEPKSKNSTGSKPSKKRKGQPKPNRKEANQAVAPISLANESNTVMVEPSSVLRQSGFRFPPSL